MTAARTSFRWNRLEIVPVLEVGSRLDIVPLLARSIGLIERGERCVGRGTSSRSGASTVGG